jgi:effector-binding domain-containing protein
MPEELQLEQELVAGVRGEVTAAELPEFFAVAVDAANSRLPREIVTGPMIAVYHRDEGDCFDVTIGFVVSEDPGDSEFEVVTLPGGPALREVHRGDYPQLSGAYARLRAALKERGRELGLAWERYLTSPGENPDPETWVTEVVVPLRD